MFKIYSLLAGLFLVYFRKKDIQAFNRQVYNRFCIHSYIISFWSVEQFQLGGSHAYVRSGWADLG